jgi:hypothetical protein
VNKIFLIFLFLIFFGCNNEKNDSSNTFYVDYTCKNDTLLKVLNNATTGKASYFDNEKELQIVSLNYVTEDHPNTHYFKISDELPVKPELNTIKYEIIFNDSMINDSIAYSLKKYVYLNNGWQTKSLMGTFKVFNYTTDLDKRLKVINKNVASSVLKTIVSDTYDK